MLDDRVLYHRVVILNVKVISFHLFLTRMTTPYTQNLSIVPLSDSKSFLRNFNIFWQFIH